MLEDSPLFNAGRGSVLTAAGTVEMDAAVMMGEKPSAGAVASVTGSESISYPITAAVAFRDVTCFS